MTYSYNNGSSNSNEPSGDQTGYEIGDGSNIDIDNLPIDLPDLSEIDEAEQERLKEIVINEIKGHLSDLVWQNFPDLFGIRECVGHKFQIKNSVDEYDYNNVNDDNQFPLCETKEFVYPSGWDYVDFTPGPDTGRVGAEVRVIRFGILGPTDDFNNEKNNPYRLAHLPPRTTKWITAEPKKFLWVHPYLDRYLEPAEEGEDPEFLSFSFYTTMAKWQSGKLANSPNDFNIANNAGFWTHPGGKNASNLDNSDNDVYAAYPCAVDFTSSSSYDKGKGNYEANWIGVYGYSRGKEGMGYPDEPTEGREYDCVGFSGWFTSQFNQSAGTNSNVGIKFAYTMNRMDTSARELKLNAQLLEEFMQNIGDLFPDEGEPDGTFSVPPSIEDIEDETGGGVGEYSANDKSIIKRSLDYAHNLVEKLRGSEVYSFRYSDLLENRFFEKLDGKLIPNISPAKDAITLIFDFANDKLNDIAGNSSKNYKNYIDAQRFLTRIESGEQLDKKSFFNYFLTNTIIGDEEICRNLPFDIDFHEIAKVDANVLDPKDSINYRMLRFILEMKDKDYRTFYVDNGVLTCELNSGFIIDMIQEDNGLYGWCEACQKSGGVITHPNNDRVDCTIVEDLLPYSSAYSERVLDSYLYDDNEGFGDPREKLRKSTGLPPSQLSTRLLNPVEGGQDIDVEIKGQQITAQQWRGFYACPSPAPGAKPDWKNYEEFINCDGTPNILHTYGPFTDAEKELFYHWVTPPDWHTHNPRDDYGLTFWWANRPDAPPNEWSQTVTTPPQNAGKSQGYKTSKPKGTYFRVSFYQWELVGGRKGPKIREEHYTPCYKIAHNQTADEGRHPEGVWFDGLVTPGDGKDPYEHYRDGLGPSYLTLDYSGNLGQYEDAYWDKPLTTLELSNGYYKFWTKKPEEMPEALQTRPSPAKQGVFRTYDKSIALDFTPQNGDPEAWREGWGRDTTLKGVGDGQYRTVYIDASSKNTFIFPAVDETRKVVEENNVITDYDWAKGGEPWVEYQKINRDKWLYGPAYWGELHKNRERPYFHADKWQTPLNVITNGLKYANLPEYKLDVDNVSWFEGARITIKATPGYTNPETGGSSLIGVTQYDYDVYISANQEMEDVDANYSEVINFSEDKQKFIYLGYLAKDDFIGFTFTAPPGGGALIFAARNTQRLVGSWKNNGEFAYFRTREEVNPRDEREGPAYWAFGDFGSVPDIRRGFRGYVDFNKSYWAGPLNHWNQYAPAGQRVKRGRKYKIKVGPNTHYTHRIIWGNPSGLDENKALEPILFKDPGFHNDKIDTDPNTKWYHFEDDNTKLLRPVHSGQSKEVVVEAKSDIMFFGAFRYDQTDDDASNPLVDRPTYDQWSRYGEMVDITVEEFIEPEGCGYWASQGPHYSNVLADINTFDRPINHLTAEMRKVASDDGININTLEGEEITSTREDGSIETWARRFDIIPGKQYVVLRTDRSPEVSLSPRWISNVHNKPLQNSDVLTNDEDKAFEWVYGNNTSDAYRFVSARSEYLYFDVYYSDKTREEYSNKGEPQYLELYEVVDRGRVVAKQYWTDWVGTSPIAYTAETANSQLNDAHWNPKTLYRLPGDKVKPGKKYKIYVEDGENALGQGKPNPNYLTVFFADKAPQAIQVGVANDYKYLGTVGDQTKSVENRAPSTNLRGEANAAIIKVPEDRPYVVVGAWATNNNDPLNPSWVDRRPGGIKGWDKGGEDISLIIEEVPEENVKGPVYYGNHWADGLINMVDDQGTIEQTTGFPDIGRGEDIEQPRSAQNPAYYTAAYMLGENGDEPSIRIGDRYRIVRDDTGRNQWKPEDYKQDAPYNLRLWFVNNPTFALDPDKSDFQYFSPDISTHIYGDYFDFISQTKYAVFGAHSNLNSRLPDTWSKIGEPIHWKVEKLPDVPYSGPVYYQHEFADLAAVDHERFYKPLNVIRVQESSKYELVPNEKWDLTEYKNTEFWVWFIKDDFDKNWEKVDDWMKSRQNRRYFPIPIDGRHPESLIMTGDNQEKYIPQSLREQFYVKGVQFRQRDGQPPVINVPPKCNRMFFGVWNYKDNDITKFNRDGERMPFTVEKKDYGNKEGPLYWGDNTVLEPGFAPPTEFNNPHFEYPLRHFKIDSEKIYKVTKANATSMNDFGVIDIYNFDWWGVNELDPELNKPQNWTRIGEFKSTDTEITIEPTKDGLILAAREIKPIHNTPRVTDWSPKGEPSPLDFEATQLLKGPLYYAESDGEWPGGAGPNNGIPDGINPNHAHLPNFSSPKWSSPLTAMKVPGGTGEYDIVNERKMNDYGVTIWYVTQEAHLKPGVAANKTNFKYLGDVSRGTGKQVYNRVPPDAKYVVFGAYMHDPNTRTFESWSKYGEPVPFEFKKVRWGKGPGYPAKEKSASGNYRIDMNEERWTFGNALTPNGKNKFTGGQEYKFKRTAGEQHDKQYQIVWSTVQFPTKDSQLTYGEKLNPRIDKKKKKIRCPVGHSYCFFSMYDSATDRDPGGPPPEYWSPNGTSIPYTAKKDRSMPTAIPGWLKALLAALAALLAALLAVLLYFAAISPLEILLEMSENEGLNEYDIKRKKVVISTDPESGEEKIGYNYPNEEYIYNHTDVYTGLKNDPIFFNWVADRYSRAWGRIMKLRHNGYMIHMSNAKHTNTSKDWTKKKQLHLEGVSPTYGYNFTGLRNPGVKRAFKYYNAKDKDRNITRWNKADSEGVKIVRPDVTNDHIKQTLAWDNAKQWFTPVMAYVPYINSQKSWKTKGGATYKLASNFSSTYLKYSNIISKGPESYIWNIFNEIGGGFQFSELAPGYSGDTSSHAYAMEILNGDSIPWPGIENGRGDFYPGIEFDLKPPEYPGSNSKADQWQIVQMHLNYFYYDAFNPDDNIIASRQAVKLQPQGHDPYTFRNTFDNSPSHSKYGQMKDKPVHINLKGTTRIQETAIFESLSICIWIASNAGQGHKCIISNLKPTITY